jgi:hypothetical protein
MRPSRSDVRETRAAFFRSPEFRLLAECAYYIPERWLQQRARLEELAESVNGEKFLQLVKRHRVPALAGMTLARASNELNLQLPFLEILRRWESENRKRNLMLHVELHRLQRSFNEAGIAMVALKGSGLSQRLYGDIGVRHMLDIDIAAAPSDMVRAWSLMNQLGYRTTPARNKRTEDLIRRIFREIECIDPTRGIQVDLHWRFEEVRSAAFEDIWWREIRGSDLQRRHCVELLYLCQHGARHGWNRLKWLGDVRILFGRIDAQEWTVLLELAALLHLEAAIAETLLLLEWLFYFELGPEAQRIVSAHRSVAERSAKVALQCLQSPANDSLTENSEGLFAAARRVIQSINITLQCPRRHSRLQLAGYVALLLTVRGADVEGFPLPIYLAWMYPLVRVISVLYRRVLISR